MPTYRIYICSIEGNEWEHKVTLNEVPTILASLDMKNIRKICIEVCL